MAGLIALSVIVLWVIASVVYIKKYNLDLRISEGSFNKNYFIKHDLLKLPVYLTKDTINDLQLALKSRKMDNFFKSLPKTGNYFHIKCPSVNLYCSYDYVGIIESISEDKKIYVNVGGKIVVARFTSGSEVIRTPLGCNDFIKLCPDNYTIGEYKDLMVGRDTRVSVREYDIDDYTLKINYIYIAQ